MTTFTNNRIVQVDFDSSTEKALSGSCRKLLLISNQDAYIRFNVSSVTNANGFLIPAKTLIEIPLALVDQVAVVKDSSAGKLTILELF